MRIDDELDLPARISVVSSLPVAAGADIAVEPVAGLPATLEPRVLSERFFRPEASAAHVARGEAEGHVRLGWRVLLPG